MQVNCCYSALNKSYSDLLGFLLKHFKESEVLKNTQLFVAQLMEENASSTCLYQHLSTGFNEDFIGFIYKKDKDKILTYDSKVGIYHFCSPRLLAKSTARPKQKWSRLSIATTLVTIFHMLL